MWLLFLKKIDDKYLIKQAGMNIIPTEEYDKVLPTTEQIARQSEKVFFDGVKLRLKNGESLMSVEKLNETIESYGHEEISSKNLYDLDEKV